MSLFLAEDLGLHRHLQEDLKGLIVEVKILELIQIKMNCGPYGITQLLGLNCCSI